MPSARSSRSRRRVILGEVIAHAEKVFSVFETHTEWISKGKAGVPVELGVRVGVMEDQHRFVLHHRVMAGETDDKVAVVIVRDTKHRFADLGPAALTKDSIHRPTSRTSLSSWSRWCCRAKASFPKNAALSNTVRRSNKRAATMLPSNPPSMPETYTDWTNAATTASPVLNAMLPLAVVARDIHRIGDILWQQEQAREKRRRAAKQGWQNKSAA